MTFYLTNPFMENEGKHIYRINENCEWRLKKDKVRHLWEVISE